MSVSMNEHAITRLAPAKVNLFLHVGAVQADGYHPLESLVAFADIGDRVTVEPAEQLSLSIGGPFGASLAGEGDNLILTGLRALGQAAGIGDPAVSVFLDKRLPIAAGLGGGSSDAGAAIRAVAQLLDLPLDDAALEKVARAVGADGPMCLRTRTAYASGVGEVLRDMPRMPPLHAVLLNTGHPSPTGAVYRAYDAAPSGSADLPAEPSNWSFEAVVEWLAQQRNDLEAPALAVTPAIAEGLEIMRCVPGCRLARMSGSGATVFGLFETRDEAIGATMLLDRVDWWVRPAVLGNATP